MSKRTTGRPKGTTLARKNIYEADFKKLIDYIDSSSIKTKQNAKKAFYLLYYFGFRAGELTKLKNSHIQKMAREDVISIGNDTKTKKAREAYIAPENTALLKEIFHEELTEDENFTLLSPTKNRLETYNQASFIKMLNRVIKMALGKQYSTHSFRAGYITTLHRAGVSIPVIQEVIGHTKPNTTMRYIKVDEFEKRDAVRRIA